MENQRQLEAKLEAISALISGLSKGQEAQELILIRQARKVLKELTAVTLENTQLLKMGMIQPEKLAPVCVSEQ